MVLPTFLCPPMASSVEYRQLPVCSFNPTFVPCQTPFSFPVSWLWEAVASKHILLLWLVCPYKSLFPYPAHCGESSIDQWQAQVSASSGGETKCNNTICKNESKCNLFLRSKTKSGVANAPCGAHFGGEITAAKRNQNFPLPPSRSDIYIWEVEMGDDSARELFLPEQLPFGKQAAGNEL